MKNKINILNKTANTYNIKTKGDIDDNTRKNNKNKFVWRI